MLQNNLLEVRLKLLHHPALAKGLTYFYRIAHCIHIDDLRLKLQRKIVLRQGQNQLSSLVPRVDENNSEGRELV